MNRRMATTGVALFVWLGLTGGAIGDATVYDFSTGAGVDRFAYGISVPDIPIPPTVNIIPSAVFSPADYTAVALSDDVRHSTGIVEGGIVAATRFVFTVVEPPASVTQIDVLWEGGASEGKAQSVWLWNDAAGSYVLVGIQNVVVPPDGVVTASFTSNLSEFIDAANAVTVLVTYNASGGALLTDYVSVTVSGPQCFSDADCDDGLICNGIETCVSGLCQPGTPLDCDDGIPCTIDVCTEPTGLCDHVPDDAACDNGVFCDGVESCDPVAGCQAGTPVDCDDGIACTTDSCNEGAIACDHIPDAPGCLTPSRWYVDADAVGANDGTSWANAFNTLQDAFAAVVYSDEVWIAAGTYKPDEGAGRTPGDMAATFWLRNGVAVYGHFLGTETTFAERDLTDMADPLRQTVLGGDIGIPGNPTDNTTHVVTVVGVDDTTVLGGFTIRDGSAPDVLAGGGGMLISTGSPTIRDCTFIANHAGAWGGGVNNDFGTPSLLNCTFTSNTGNFGGGMANRYGTAVLIGCTFTANEADETGGGMAELYGDSTLTNCRFFGNFTIAVNGMGGGMYVSEFGGVGNATLTNCLFIGNTSAHGGGMLASGFATLANCTFSQNNADFDSGGFGTWGFASSLANCVLWGNTAGVGTLERQQLFGAGPLSVDHSCVQGWTGALGGVGNIGGDPLFANPGAGDYHLSAGSSCIDAADNTAVPADTADLDGDGNTTERTPLDLDANPRFVDDPATVDTGVPDPPVYPQVADMGSFEFQVPTACATCPGDLDGDNGVAGDDIRQFVACFLAGPTVGPLCGCADMDNSTTIDSTDAMLFVTELLSPTCP